MSPSAPDSIPAGRPIEVGPVLVGFGALLALSLGLAAGFPTGDTRNLALVLIGLVAMITAAMRPLAALLVMYASCIALIVWVVGDSKAINSLDLLMFPLLISGFFGSARRNARAEDECRTSPEHRAMRQASRRLTRSVTVYYLLAVLSLIVLGLRGHWPWAGNSALLLVRGLQGVGLFVLGMWWLRTESDLRAALRAVQIGMCVLLALNVWFLIVAEIPRAGMTWVINEPEWPMTSPNEAAVTLLIVIAMTFAWPRATRDPVTWVLLAVALVLLILTRSRSGLLAWLAYGVASFRWRWSSFFRLAGSAAVVLPLVPGDYWGRLERTVSPSGGSFETFTTVIRLYTWDTAWKVFLDYPLYGVGYLGFRFVSVGYNEMKLVLNTCENYFIETAVGMGIPGFLALVVAIVALIRLGEPARAAPEGSLARGMARRHRPLMLGLLVANLTADNFMGMVGLAQVALWCVLLIRSTHLALDARAKS